MATVGFIQDPKTWAQLLDWVRAQKFADHADKLESVPYRVENILRHYARFTTWDGTQMQYAKGFIAGHYTAKFPPPELTSEERIKLGQTQLPM